jgi:hypothetical protein
MFHLLFVLALLAIIFGRSMVKSLLTVCALIVVPAIVGLLLVATYPDWVPSWTTVGQLVLACGVFALGWYGVKAFEFSVKWMFKKTLSLISHLHRQLNPSS